MSKNTKDITEILSNYKNIKTIQMNNKTQKGGTVAALAVVGSATVSIGKFVGVGIIEVLRRFFFAPWFWDVEWWDFGGWEAGLFWRYVWWCIKSVTYLMIFAIGGPVITIIGVFFLYKNLGTKFGERSDERMYEETYGQPGYESGSE